jgi:hypothetical protein
VKDPIEIEYREFYDYPRLFLVSLQGRDYFFDASFDDQIDDYPEVYQVDLMPTVSTEQRAGSWMDLRKLAIQHVGATNVDELHFDPTRRRYVEADDVRRFAVGPTLGRTGTE